MQHATGSPGRASSGRKPGRHAALAFAIGGATF